MSSSPGERTIGVFRSGVQSAVISRADSKPLQESTTDFLLLSELGQAPDMIFAAHVAGNRVEMTRPLCPYPELAVYKGSGSTNDADNFACKMP